MIEQTCPICSSGVASERVGQYKYKNHLFSGRELFQCGSCGLVFIGPMPTEVELNEYYQTVWLNDEPKTSNSSDVELVYKIQALERVKYLKREIGLFDGMSVLDVGSGFGYLYDAFKDAGCRKISFYATDPSPANLERLRNRGAESYENIKDIRKKDFDIACACSVLEHVNDPLSFLRTIAEYLKPKGYLFVDLPERDDEFKPIFEPHVAFYSRESLGRALDKAGYEVVHIAGFGLERSKIRLNGKTNLIMKIWNKIKDLSNSVGIKRDKVKELYEQYRFDEEGNDRWWIRVVARKK